jgi:hypothetical protein
VSSRSVGRGKPVYKSLRRKLKDATFRDGVASVLERKYYAPPRERLLAELDRSRTLALARKMGAAAFRTAAVIADEKGWRPRS